MLNAFYSSKFPILNVDDTFFLREQMIKDVEAFFEYYADPDVAHYILASNPRNLAEAAAESPIATTFSNIEGVFTGR